MKGYDHFFTKQGANVCKNWRISHQQILFCKRTQYDHHNLELQETRRNYWQAEFSWIFIAVTIHWVYHLSKSTLNVFHSLAHWILVNTLKGNTIISVLYIRKLKHRLRTLPGISQLVWDGVKIQTRLGAEPFLFTLSTTSRIQAFFPLPAISRNLPKPLQTWPSYVLPTDIISENLFLYTTKPLLQQSSVGSQNLQYQLLCKVFKVYPLKPSSNPNPF